MMRPGLVTLAALALGFAACTKNNPNYCTAAGAEHGYSCAELDALPQDHHVTDVGSDAPDVAEVAVDAADAADAGDTADAVADLVVEKPMCPAICPDMMPICDVDAGACRTCSTPGECKTLNSGLRACENGQCVECSTAAECTVAATKPVCKGNACVGCVVDADCPAGPGICMEDGSCLADADAIYASIRASGCPGTGTATDPFCSLQLAASTAVTMSKRAVVLQGAGSFSVLSFNAPGKQLAIISKSGAVLVPGLDNQTATPQIGISVTDGDLLVRGIEIKGGGTTGVDAEGGTIRLHRCLIDGNTDSGLLVKNAGFHIENTVFSNNGGATKANVDLEATASTVKVFRNNTVISGSTAVAGVVCAAAYPITGSIVFGGSVPVGPACVFNDKCSMTGCFGQDPKLDASFALTAQSPPGCIDALTSGAPPLDRLGTVRPVGAGSDCGADERGP
jgi:hypothetical protein